MHFAGQHCSSNKPPIVWFSRVCSYPNYSVDQPLLLADLSLVHFQIFKTKFLMHTMQDDGVTHET